MNLTVEKTIEGYKVFPASGIWQKGGVPSSIPVLEVAETVRQMGYEINPDYYSFTNADEHFPDKGCLETILAVIFYVD